MSWNKYSSYELTQIYKAVHLIQVISTWIVNDLLDTNCSDIIKYDSFHFTKSLHISSGNCLWENSEDRTVT